MTSMKGLYKGFRYISQIFEEEKADEMEIGFPTDVKHVAHIGSDGPSTNQPSWMNEFKPDENKPVETQSREIQLEGNVGTGKEVSGTDSPTRQSSQKKQHRRHRSGSGSISSPGRDPTSAAPTKPRRPKASGGESPAREPKNADPSGAPKQSRKKKTKDSSGGPDKLPRPKGSDRSRGSVGDSGEFCPSPAYEDRGDGRGGCL